MSGTRVVPWDERIYGPVPGDERADDPLDVFDAIDMTEALSVSWWTSPQRREDIRRALANQVRPFSHMNDLYRSGPDVENG